MAKETSIVVRDSRGDNRYWIDNELIDRWGETIGAYGVAVYNVLARFANNKSQDCYPSVATIGKRINVSAPKVTTTLQLLEKVGLIKITHQRRSETGRPDSPNIYTLLDLGSIPTKEGLNDINTGGLNVVNTPLNTVNTGLNVVNTGSKPHLDGVTTTFRRGLNDVTTNKTNITKLNNKTNLKTAADADPEKNNEIGEIFTVLEGLWGTLSAPVSDKVKSLVADFGTDWVLRAVTEGALHQAKNIIYIERILDNWKRNGIREVQSARYGATGTGNRLGATGIRSAGQNARTGPNQQPGTGSGGSTSAISGANGRYANPQIAAKYDHLFERDE